MHHTLNANAETEIVMVKLSKTSKLGTKSWSLQAFETCPGARNDNGAEVDACRGCYARAGMYHFGAVKAVRALNKSDWKRADWTTDMINALRKEKHFRWFDSGDMYSLSLARKMYAIMAALPNTQFWLPTRMAKFAKFKSIIADMQALPNVMVRFSSDSINGEYTPGVHGSTIIPTVNDATDDMFVCGAYDNDGKCGTCRACYNKDIPIIAYPAHGKTMKKIIRIAAAS